MSTLTGTTADAASMKRHLQVLQTFAQFMDTRVLETADSLYPFQYGSDERTHVTENRELRPLFTKLNDCYADWERARTAFVTGDYSVDPLQVMKRYRKLFAKFNRAFVVIGFAEDFEDVYARLTATTEALLVAVELAEIVF